MLAILDYRNYLSSQMHPSCLSRRSRTAFDQDLYFELDPYPVSPCHSRSLGDGDVEMDSGSDYENMSRMSREPEAYDISFVVQEPDRWLPLADVSRIMKRALPSNASISKAAKETMQECVSELISFISSEAVESTRRRGRKTLRGEEDSVGFS